MSIEHVVLFSGGTASAEAGLRVAERYGPENIALVSQLTRAEDLDSYRFMLETAAYIGAPVYTAMEGRTPAQVFRDEGFLGNHLVAPCSRVLKKEIGDAWLKAHCDPATTTVYLGMDWTEGDRHKSAAKRLAPYRVVSPLAEWKPWLTKDDTHRLWIERGIPIPALYKEGYSNNNCGGLCIRGGQAHWVHVLRQNPAGFAEMEALEDEISAQRGKVVTILRHRDKEHAGEPFPLRELRRRYQCGDQIDMFDFGGCGCDAYVAPESVP